MIRKRVLVTEKHPDTKWRTRKRDSPSHEKALNKKSAAFNRRPVKVTVLEDSTYCELHIGHLRDQSYGYKVFDGGFCEIGNLSDCFSRKCRGELS